MPAAPVPPAAQQERSRRTRRVLLDAGLTLLAEQGAEALTITAVSARAQVASGTVYRRFGDKEGLLAALQQEFTAGYAEELDRRMRAPGHPAGTAPAVVVDAAVRALTGTFRAHETLLRVFVLLGMRDERMAATGARASYRGGTLFRDLLWSHREAFTAADAERAVDTAYRLVYAACMHRVLHGALMESPTELGWDELTVELSRSTVLYLLGSLPGRAGTLDRGRT